MDKKSTQSNPPTPEKTPTPPISSLDTGGSSSQQHTHQPMSSISSFSTIEKLADEHEICDEYLTNGYLTEQQEHQLRLDEEALRETLEEEAKAEKYNASKQFVPSRHQVVSHIGYNRSVQSMQTVVDKGVIWQRTHPHRFRTKLRI
nr:hypothetical protein [Tanacetum cinerariifolium]